MIKMINTSKMIKISKMKLLGRIIIRTIRTSVGLMMPLTM